MSGSREQRTEPNELRGSPCSPLSDLLYYARIGLKVMSPPLTWTSLEN